MSEREGGTKMRGEEYCEGNERWERNRRGEVRERGRGKGNVTYYLHHQSSQ